MATRQIAAPLYGYSIVSPSHLRTYRIPIVQGRDFTDGIANESELIIDQATARFLWPGGDPIGRLIKLGDDTSTMASDTGRFNSSTTMPLMDRDGRSRFSSRLPSSRR